MVFFTHVQKGARKPLVSMQTEGAEAAWRGPQGRQPSVVPLDSGLSNRANGDTITKQKDVWSRSKREVQSPDPAWLTATDSGS